MTFVHPIHQFVSSIAYPLSERIRVQIQTGKVGEPLLVTPVAATQTGGRFEDLESCWFAEGGLYGRH
jgi:hypothetical protein